MSRTHASGSVLAVAFLVGLAGSVNAQTTYPNVRVTGRLQEQFYYFGNEDYAGTTGPKSNFFTRRARIEARGNINEYVTVYIQPSFEGGRSTSGSCNNVVVPGPLPDTIPVTCNLTGGVRLRDAWIDLRLNNIASKTGFIVRVGQEKRPFSRYELTSSNNLPSIERGGGRGILPLASNDLFTGQGFVSHDVGASARIEHKLDDAGRLVTVTA